MLVEEIKASQAEVKPLLSVDEYSKQLEEIEILNSKIRANKYRKGIEAESILLKEESEGLTEQIENYRKRKTLLLMNAKFPLPEMGFADGELLYRGQRWDNMRSRAVNSSYSISQSSYPTFKRSTTR